MDSYSFSETVRVWHIGISPKVRILKGLLSIPFVWLHFQAYMSLVLGDVWDDYMFQLHVEL
jgi:hypothetical protein